MAAGQQLWQPGSPTRGKQRYCGPLQRPLAPAFKSKRPERAFDIIRNPFVGRVNSMQRPTDTSYEHVVIGLPRLFGPDSIDYAVVAV